MDDDLLKQIDGAILRAWHMGQSYMADAQSDSQSDNRRAIETREDFHAFRNNFMTRLSRKPSIREDA